MLFFEISELELMVAGRPRGLLRGGRFQVLSAPVLCEISIIEGNPQYIATKTTDILNRNRRSCLLSRGGVANAYYIV